MTLAAIFLALTMWGQPTNSGLFFDPPAWTDQQGNYVLCCSDAIAPHYSAKDFRAPDPIDVPAIKGEHSWETDAGCDYPREKPWASTDGTRGCWAITWTCADKSRTLLTAEDGSKHCIKFQRRVRP